MKITNLADLSENEFAKLENELVKHKTLGKVLTWAGLQSKAIFCRERSPKLLRRMNLRTML